MRFLGWLFAIVGVLAVLACAGYFALRRGDIAYETLAARYETAASHYAELPNGIRMHYLDEGDTAGPTLLLIHGFSASSHTWAGWAQRLGDEYHVISIDLPGHGLTRAPAGYSASIEAFRDAVEAFAAVRELQSFTVAGNSMGGNVAWEYALAHPERVDALILVDSSGWPLPDTFVQPATFEILRNPVVGPLLRDLDNTRLVRRGLQASFFDAALVDDAMVERYASLSRAPGHRDIILQMATNFADRNFATSERLAPLSTLPTLIVWGDTDNLVPIADAALFHEALPRSQVVVFEHTGHIPQEEQAAASAAAVREFLYSVYEPSALAEAG
jgi:pimeloyl-ACP methyl ester carboxylesterase